MFTTYLNNGLNRAIKKCRWTQSKFFATKGKKSDLDKNFFGSAAYQSLKMINDEFDAWLTEMEQNKPSFTPFFSVGAHDIMKLRKGKNPQGNTSCKDIDCKNADLVLSKQYQGSLIGRLVNMFADSTEYVCNNKKII